MPLQGSRRRRHERELRSAGEHGGGDEGGGTCRHSDGFKGDGAGKHGDGDEGGETASRTTEMTPKKGERRGRAWR